MAIEDYLFPMQSLTTKAAMNPNANTMGMATSPFAIQSAGQGGALMGLAGLMDQYGAMRQQEPEQPVTSSPAKPLAHHHSRGVLINPLLAVKASKPTRLISCLKTSPAGSEANNG